MAAISGVLRFNGAPAAALGKRIATRMIHRSPDGIRLWDSEAVALGFGALHANAEAALEAQPLQQADGAVLVVDGWVQDRSGLGHALGIASERLATMGDGRLLALAWLRWREDLWRHVTAEYAMAVWEPAQARLSLVRDRIGMRPLYVVKTPDMFAFASEAEAMLGLPGVATAPNLERVASNLAPRFDDIDRGATLYRDVRRVQSGEILEVRTSGQSVIRTYFRFEPQEPLHLASHGGYVEAFRSTFDTAVRASLRGTSSPALMLSGGIDSAAVHASALAQGLPLRRISVLADQAGAEEERANIETLLVQSPDVVRLDVSGLGSGVDLGALAKEVFDRAHPVSNSILLPMLVNQAARASGSRVIVDGIDGDLVMSAPDNYIGRLALAGRWASAFREARAASRTHTYLKHLPAWKILGWGVASRMEPALLACWRYRMASSRAGEAAYLGMLHPNLVHTLQLRKRSLAQRIALRGDPTLRDWSSYRAWVWANPGFMRGGEGYDMVASRFGLEARHPWCDSRVVDLFLRLPMDVVVREGWTKHVARFAYAPELGAVAWHSGKKHLGPQVTKLLLQAGGSDVEEALQCAQGVLKGVVDPRAIAAAQAAWVSGLDDLTANDAIIDVVTMARWLSTLNQQSIDSDIA